MYDNWTEIIEIMKPILDLKRSKMEVKMAFESCLRTLGWRSSTGSMKNDFVTRTGKTIDIVLGVNQPNEAFRPVLPIIINTESTTHDIVDSVLTTIQDINAKVCIVVNSSISLFIMDQTSQNPVNIGEIPFESNNEEGIKFSSLLSANDFQETNLVAYFDTLYKTKLPAIKLEAIIKSITSDESKAMEVLRLYLELEGFEGEIVDNALKDVGINIFLKNEMASEPNPNVQSYAERQSNKSGHDNTRFSLCDGPFLNKRQFVLAVVTQYIKDHPSVTLKDLEIRFPSEIISKVRGVVRTWAQVKLWADQYGPDILGRYCSKEDERLKLIDGTEVVVNSQWGAVNFPRFLAIAKTLYDVRSNSPYEGIEHVPNNDYKTDNVDTGRAQNFKFSMAGIKIGETVIFDPTQIEVKVASNDTIEYRGKIYRLSNFVRNFLPDNMRTPSDKYRGPNYFSYKGNTLTSLRKDTCQKQDPIEQSEEQSNEKSKGIQISLNSFNTFKTKK